MAELPEVWTERTPAPRHLFDRPHTFGVAREAERTEQDTAPAPTTSEPPKHRRERGPFVTYLRLPWSYGDRDTGARWHRVQCRLGRHKVVGGYSMQVDSAIVFVERRCLWCNSHMG